MGRTQRNPPSRFLLDIPEELLTPDSNRPRHAVNRSFDSVLYTPDSSPSSQAPQISECSFSEGDKVYHKHFGAGVVVGSKLSGGDEEVTVDFKSNGNAIQEDTFSHLFRYRTRVSDSRRPIVGGNWKMNTTRTEALDLAAALRDELASGCSLDVVVFPPFTNIDAIYQMPGASPFRLGGQDVFWEERGAYTGEVSPAMLRSVGCEFVIAGHSERRHLLHESNEVVNRKLRAAIGAGLSVILAIGETEQERTSDQTDEVLLSQLQQSLKNVESSDMGRLVIAYEPVWAIGTGLTASPEQAQAAHAFIRSIVADLYGSEVAESIRIQYGGSVTPDNAMDLLSQSDVDGALVGGASLKAHDFSVDCAYPREDLECSVCPVDACRRHRWKAQQG